MKHILFLNARRRVFLANKLRSFLKNEFKQVGLASTDIDYNDPISSAVDCFDLLPPSSSPEFKNALLKLVRKRNIIGLILWNDHDFIPVYNLKDQLDELGVYVVIPPKEYIDIFSNKVKMSVFLRQHDIGTPPLYHYDRLLKDGIDSPVIIKPVEGSGNRDIFIASTIEELRFYYNRAPDPMIQKYIDGVHYTVDFFCDNEGNLKSLVPRKRVKVRDAEVVMAQVDVNPTISRNISKLAKIYSHPGPVNVQLIMNELKEIFIIDIHPRIGGGTDLTIQCGVPIHKWLVQLILDEPLTANFEINDGMFMSRYLKSVFKTKGSQEWLT